MQVEHLLAARRLVELLKESPSASMPAMTARADLLHRRHEAREIIEGRCPRGCAPGPSG